MCGDNVRMIGGLAPGIGQERQPEPPRPPLVRKAHATGARDGNVRNPGSKK